MIICSRLGQVEERAGDRPRLAHRRETGGHGDGVGARAHAVGHRVREDGGGQHHVVGHLHLTRNGISRPMI
jgi:hypothetical protein